MNVYQDYAKDRIGWFFGLTGAQALIVVTGILPVLWAVQAHAWAAAAVLSLVYAVVVAGTVIPVRGRTLAGWIAATTAYAAGALAGWIRFRAAATQGRRAPDGLPDLPGVLSGLQIHDGPPVGPHQARVALIQDHARRRWAVTAEVTHPGLGLTDTAQRERLGAGLAVLLDTSVATELVEEVMLLVRTVPDDGAERDHWVHSHRRPDAPALSVRVTDDLAAGLCAASVRTEAFVTLTVPESALNRPAKDCGDGISGRATVLYQLMGEIEAVLRGPVGMGDVAWLTSTQLAAACRTGFAPGDRAAIVDATSSPAASSQGASEGNDSGPAWSVSGPSGAQAGVRGYRHDAWASVSATLALPTRGAILGALAPVLTPQVAGERRCLLVAYPVVAAGAAARRTASNEWAADVATHLRTRAGVRPRAQARADAASAHGMDAKLAKGSALTRPYAVATVTVPAQNPLPEAGRRLDAAIRRAGFAPLRLDLAHDVAFAASVLPLGVSLRQGRR